jgi:hypothetical protein
MLIPLKMRKRGADANLPINLLRFKIHQRGAIIDAAKASIFAGVKENGLYQGSLPFTAVAEGSYVSSGGWFASLHLFSFPSLIPFRRTIH